MDGLARHAPSAVLCGHDVRTSGLHLLDVRFCACRTRPEGRPISRGMMTTPLHHFSVVLACVADPNTLTRYPAQLLAEHEIG